MTRRLVAVVAALFATAATADVVDDDDVLPDPALPIGPGPLHPLGADGPRADDDWAPAWAARRAPARRVPCR